MSEWCEYRNTKPQVKGFFEWKLRHKNGHDFTFFAEVAQCWAGHEKVLMPKFADWDGYRHHVPSGALWRPVEDQVAAEQAARDDLVQIEGLALRCCPFCGKAPKVSASQCGRPGGGDGIAVSPSPIKTNTWSVERCCGLISHNGFPSLDALQRVWNGSEWKSDEEAA